MTEQILAGALPPTHEAMIVVGLARPLPPGAAAVPGDGGTGPKGRGRSAAARSQQVLVDLQRSGRIRDVVPLVPSVAVPAGTGGMAPMFSPSAGRDTDAPSDAPTAWIVRTTDDEDTGPLLDALQATPEVEFAAPVPTRWLATDIPPDEVAARAAYPADHGSGQGSGQAAGSAQGADGGPGPALADHLWALEARLAALEALAAGAPAALARLWNLDRIGLDTLTSGVSSGGGSGVSMADRLTVAVLDTGVDADHPDLAGRVGGYVWDGPSATGRTSDRDLVGHGTHVAGVVGARLSRQMGTRGVCGASLAVWKIFDDVPDLIPGRGIYWYLVDPILYRRSLASCIERRVDVVNLSIGGTGRPDPQEETLFRLLLERGVSVVAAMGNERSLGSPVSYPAAIPGVVAVGAMSPTGTIAAFSNAGAHISLVAPGVSIWSTLPRYPGQAGFRVVTGRDGSPRPGSPIGREVQYAAMDGTSMASPHVAAAAALVQANSPRHRSPSEVRDLLMGSAQRLPAMAGQPWTADLGFGCLDLRRLLLASMRL